jgi:hypothetical protein
MFENKLAANISDICKSLGIVEKSEVLSNLATQHLNELQGLRGMLTNVVDYMNNRKQACIIVDSLVRGLSSALSDGGTFLDLDTVQSIIIQKQEKLAKFWEDAQTNKDVMRAFVRGCVSDVLLARQQVVTKMIAEIDRSNS